jgi:hypothetical protein
MLTADELRKLPDRVTALYTALETKLLKVMTWSLKRRLTSNDAVNVLTQEQNAQVRKWLLSHRQQVRKELKSTLKRALELNFKNDIKLTSSPLISAVAAANSSITNAAMRLGEQSILGELLQIDRKLPFICENTLRNTLFEVAARMEFKAINQYATYEQAIKEGIAILSKTGISLRKSNGMKEALDVVVRRCVLTGVNAAAGAASMQNMLQLGFRYVETSAHIGARNTGFGYLNHENWQGKVYEVTDPAAAAELAVLPRPIGYNVR